MATPTMEVRPRRFASPFAGQVAKLEPIHQPLYSVYLFDAALTPSEALFFQYAVGAAVASNATSPPTATFLHTNIPAAGFLPTPKMFLITGLRIIPIELAGAALNTPIDDTAAATSAVPTFVGQDSALLEDLMRIIYGSYVRLFVGTKDYLICPTWNTPGNTGIVGEAESMAFPAATPLSHITRQDVRTFHSAGKYFAFERYPILIPPQQNFSVSLNFPQSTRPTIGTARPVYAMLDGLLGRETQ